MAHRPTKVARRAAIFGPLNTVAPRNSVRRVALVFVLLLAVMLPFVILSGEWSGWQVITSATASVGGDVSRLVGLDATVDGNVIHLPSRSLAVDPACTAMTLVVIFIALVLAYPVKWPKRLLAIAIGIPVLLAANIVRLVGVGWASELIAGQGFYIVHDYLFEFAMVFVVLIMWAVWLSYARRTA